jgi:hypothetical protein
MNRAKRTSRLNRVREALVQENLASGQGLTLAEDNATLELRTYNVAGQPGLLRWLARELDKEARGVR